MEKEIEIIKYNEEKNHYEARVDGFLVVFDPFVSGILNGESHDRGKIDSLVGRKITIDVFLGTSGMWLLTSKGERQFINLINHD